MDKYTHQASQAQISNKWGDSKKKRNKGVSRRLKKGGDRPESSTKKEGELTKAEERSKNFDKKKI